MRQFFNMNTNFTNYVIISTG